MAFRFSDRVEDVDRELVHRWLSEQAYWALGRARERNDRAIDGSRVFAVLDDGTGAQVAYARVVTDGAEFAWLCDVFVDETVRGRGVGELLVRGVVDALAPLGLRRMLLATSDAHGLYRKVGFEPLEHPDRWMLLPNPGSSEPA
jgi:GNAT superfamily N-acetyltransferase